MANQFDFDFVIDGRIAVVRCAGTLVESVAPARLHRRISDSLIEVSDVILDLSQITQVDSFGLGLLARLLTLVQLGGGTLVLCAVPAHVARVLGVTHLDRTLAIHESEVAARAALALRRSGPVADTLPAGDILCVDESPEILKLVQEILRADGIRVASVRNVADAQVWLRASRPRAVIARSEIGATLHARAAHLLRAPLLGLPAAFAGGDPSIAAAELRALVRDAGLVGERT
jgi:anti-anti-sigma factor